MSKKGAFEEVPDSRLASPDDPAEFSPAEIRAYVIAMSAELAELAAQIGRGDIELKLREAVQAGARPI